MGLFLFYLCMFLINLCSSTSPRPNSIHFPDVKKNFTNEDVLHAIAQEYDKIDYTVMSCKKAFKLFAFDYKHKEAWSLQMLDASSKLPSGILYGNGGSLGNFDECLSVRFEKEEPRIPTIKGKYCLGKLIINRFDMLKMNMKPIKVATKWAICIPHYCSTKSDIVAMGRFFKDIFGRDLLKNSSLDFEEKYCQHIDSHKSISLSGIFTMLVLFLFFVIVTTSTAYEYWCKLNRQTPLSRFLISFSLITNGKNLFKGKNESEFVPVYGLRALSVLWIILGNRHHLTKLADSVILNGHAVIDWESRWYNKIYEGNFLATDTLLMLSAFITSYSYLDRRIKGIQEVTATYFIHKIVRYTPSLLAIIAINYVFLPHLANGPEYPLLIEKKNNNCGNYWWSSLLYIDNYLNPNEMCVSQSWYMDVDIQLHILSPLFLSSFWTHTCYTLNCLFLILISSMVWTSILAYKSNIAGVLPRWHHWRSYWANYFVATPARSCSWIFGAILGCCLFRYKNRPFAIKRTWLIAFWTYAFATSIFCLFFEVKGLNPGKYHSPLMSAFYLAVVRALWSLAIGWIVFACVTNYGGFLTDCLSYQILKVLGKLSLNAYLVHETVILISIYSRRSQIYYSSSSMFYYFCGDAVWSYGMAVLLVLMFEMPFVNIERLVCQKLRMSRCNRASSNVGPTEDLDMHEL